MPRELSAGGVAVRRMRGRWWYAAIRPAGRPDVLALPKGLIDQGESAAETALREVWEETGLRCIDLGRLGDVRYVYSRAGMRIFKLVIFHLLAPRSGRLGDISPAMRREVGSAAWIPLDEPQRLSYRGERDMVSLAGERLSAPADGTGEGDDRRGVAADRGSGQTARR
jgi:8-oxo-dGTP pyrophosphatase MutT (NUDIX family)